MHGTDAATRKCVAFDPPTNTVSRGRAISRGCPAEASLRRGGTAFSYVLSKDAVYLALLALAWHGAARGQSAADLQAARETGLPGLRLVDVRDVDYHLGSLGIQLAYVEQDVSPGGGRYFCGALSADRSATVAPPVAAGLARLPYWSVRKLGLRYVLLCGGAKYDDRPIGGVAVAQLDLFILDVSGSANAAFLETATLHELYHVAESRFNTLRDVDWDTQFAGYAYRYAPDLLKHALDSGRPGFLNEYAQTFPHEERAELFTALLLTPGDVLARIRATSDSVLRRKVLYMEEKCYRLLALRFALERL